MTSSEKTERSSGASVKRDFDVVVAGGGPAGVAAALSAARAGAKTALIEVHGCLGGVWTAGQLAWVFEGGNPGIASEIALKLGAAGARRGSRLKTYSYDVEGMKLLLERLCLEASVKIRLHTRVVGAELEGGRLSGLFTESKSGRELWRAKAFIDCSGDGDLGALAGCSFEMGGPEGQLQPCTMMGVIAVKNVADLKDFVSFMDESDPWGSHESCVANFQREMARLKIELSYARPTIFHMRDNLCALMANHEYKVRADDADALTEATLRGRAEINRVVDGLRSLGGVWEGVCLAATAEQIGVREGRRLRGLYSLNDEDIVSGARFEDAVCSCSFNVDVHSPDPGKHKGLSHMGLKTKPYQIPYRCLVAKDVDGLLMAGRCISGGWLPHASYRVTGTAVSLGEAAGKAAAYCAKHGKSPREISWSEIEPQAS